MRRREWGYATDWAGQNRAVEFFVDVPVTGRYELDFRYGSASARATRQLQVDGTEAIASLAFPATAAGVWSNVVAPASLTAPRAKVTLLFDQAKGSLESFDLDSLTVRKRP